MASFLAFLEEFAISYQSWRELIFRWTAELVHGDDFDVDQWNGPLFAQRCVLTTISSNDNIIARFEF